MPVSPHEVFTQAYSEFQQDDIAISFSGAEDVVLIDLATRLVGTNIQVFTLDTGRLHPETYTFIERVREYYSIAIDVLSPDAQSLEEMVREKGLFSFYTDGHTECCGVRKVEPLQRKLTALKAWITGQRRDQGATRNHIPHRQVDQTFSSPTQELVKFNPLADWSSTEVWNYIKEHDVPYNELHDRGYLSIGCVPCTRPVAAGEPERSGRWWWEHEEDKECGLHAQNTQVRKLTLKTSDKVA